MLNLKIEIDSGSGFCHGVIRAIECAESNLGKIGHLYSLGAIVHNNAELERLNRQGLTVIDYGTMRELHGSTVLIRAHGEPPATYETAKENNIKLIDCTCPVVLKLQERIRESYKLGAQIVIFGKEGHAEVNGLVGQTEGNAIVVDLKDGVVKGLERIDFCPNGKPVVVFSQTTKDPKEYAVVCRIIGEELVKNGSSATNRLVINNTICRQVAHRQDNLREFARNHSVIVFVSGADSSNGKVLFELCKSVNPRSYHIENSSEIKPEWFAADDSVGLCGATSTPKWQLDEVAECLTGL